MSLLRPFASRALCLTLCVLALSAEAGRPRSARAPAKRRLAAAKAEPPAPKSEPAASESPAPAAPSATRGPTRIDFDDRLIQGQTNRSGAVYLYDRKELPLHSLVKKRQTFREQIAGSAYAR